MKTRSNGITYSVEVIGDAGYVQVLFAGEVTKVEHEAGRHDAIRALAANGLHRLLVDARTIDAKMSLFDDYEFTSEHQSSPLLSVRMAIVHRPEESERFTFIENVSVNRGGQMKTFTDPEEALNWLTST